MKKKEKQEFQCGFTVFKRNETKVKMKTEKKIAIPWKTEYMRTKKNRFSGCEHHASVG